MELILIAVILLLFGLFWLLPLHFICKWAQRQRKNHRLVLVVGLLTGWLIALVVALMLPVLSDETLQIETRKDEKASKGERVKDEQFEMVMWWLGVMALILIGFMLWMEWLI
jgi:hypothetical protein